MYYVYIMASNRNGTLYTGVTNDIGRRAQTQKQGSGGGFTKRYGVSRLVHCEPFECVRSAIQREKNLKKWPRKWKLSLIEKNNPEWRDLLEQHLW